MSGVIENGKRLPVVFGSYAGEAGICERSGGAREVAMFAQHKALRKVTSGTIDGVAHQVLAVAASTYVAGMVVLTVSANA